MLVLAVVLLWAYVWVLFFIADLFTNIAIEKGYDDRIPSIWAACFWLGVIGYFYVYVLPDKELQRQKSEIADLMARKHRIHFENVYDN